MCFKHICIKICNKKLHVQMVQKLLSHTFSYSDSSSGRMRKKQYMKHTTQDTTVSHFTT